MSRGGTQLPPPRRLLATAALAKAALAFMPIVHAHARGKPSCVAGIMVLKKGREQTTAVCRENGKRSGGISRPKLCTYLHRVRMYFEACTNLCLLHELKSRNSLVWICARPLYAVMHGPEERVGESPLEVERPPLSLRQNHQVGVCRCSRPWHCHVPGGGQFFGHTTVDHIVYCRAV